MTTQTKTTMPDHSREAKAGWRKVKLREVVEKVIDNRGKTPPLSKTGYPMIEVFQLSRSRMYPDLSDAKKQKFVSEDTYKNWFRSGHPKEGDILMSTVGTIAQWDLMPNEKYCIAQNIVALRPDLSKTTPEFLRFFFNQRKFVSQVEGIVIGATQPSVRLPHFLNLEIEIPTLEIQKRIADILSAFDDKIELNNKISRTLEQMAQAIFKEWFIKKSKFKSQDEKLWKVRNVMEIVKRIPVGKKYDNKTAFLVGRVPILDQGQSGYIGYHNDEPGVMASIDEPVIVFTNHTCNYRLMTRPFSAIQNVLPYIGINGYPTIFVYYLTRGRITMQEYKGHWPEFEQQEFLVPPPKLAVEFVSCVKPMVQKMVELENKNQKLAALRDLLLPKLMSGGMRA